MSTKRVDFVNEIQALLRKTDANDVQVRYGYKADGKFHDSDVDINCDKDKHECVLIKYDNCSDEYAIIRSIALDGFFWMLKDIVSAVYDYTR